MHFILSIKCSIVAQAKDIPSYVDVPLPISSSTTNELSVAELRIFAVSIISTIKVEFPLANSSPEPTLQKSLSQIPILTFLAGQKPPACAIIKIKAFWRRKVDFPDMFGPVINLKVFIFLLFKIQLLDIKLFVWVFSTAGCLPLIISKS